MPRAIRVHAPNKGVHITARTQGGAGYFTERIRDNIAHYICEAAHSCGTRVLALAVMPNHFHLVVKQGSFPLGWMMQRAMQRIAHQVQRLHDVKGHVFGRRYWSAVCSGPDYLRQAILYTHLNPSDAMLCRDPVDYRWCSHAQFVDARIVAPWQELLAISEGRLLFAHDSFQPTAITQNYMRFVKYWIERRRNAVPGDRFVFASPDDLVPPRADLGDKHWAATYSHLVVLEKPALEKADVRDRAIVVLRRIDPDCDIDMIRNAGRNRQLCRLRRELIAALLSYGYRGASIARCLRVSQSVVSDVARSMRGRSDAA